jgi:glycerate 2-kinase
MMNLDQARKNAPLIFEAGLKAVDPGRAVRRYMRLRGSALAVGDRAYDLSEFDGVYIVGAGKAAAAMAHEAEGLLGDLVRGGIVNVKYGHVAALERVSVIEAGHPVPDEAGVRGTEQILDLLRRTGPRDLVLCLISGGGSALLVAPVPGLTLGDIQLATRRLLESGATIHEINAVRKHISRVKGGQLARLAYPSTLVSLVLSDVIGDDLTSIASGPAVPDTSTFGDCLRILEKYGLAPEIPVPVLDHLEKGTRGGIEETPKPGNPVFEKTHNVIVGSNIQAVEAAAAKAVVLGFNALILSTFIQGETREIAKMHAAVAREVRAHGHPIAPPACLVSGGETTVTVRGRGLGGRNQEFALAAALEIDGLENVVVLSGGTDGTDGPTDAAGAVADGTTVRRARELGLNPERYLRENDSYHFFERLGDLLVTGPTLTNVMDLRLVLVS